jgi:hypothetical protein
MALRPINSLVPVHLRLSTALLTGHLCERLRAADVEEDKYESQDVRKAFSNRESGSNQADRDIIGMLGSDSSMICYYLSVSNLRNLYPLTDW